MGLSRANIYAIRVYARICIPPAAVVSTLYSRARVCKYPREKIEWNGAAAHC